MRPASRADGRREQRLQAQTARADAERRLAQLDARRADLLRQLEEARLACEGHGRELARLRGGVGQLEVACAGWQEAAAACEGAAASSSSTATETLAPPSAQESARQVAASTLPVDLSDPSEALAWLQEWLTHAADQKACTEERLGLLQEEIRVFERSSQEVLQISSNLASGAVRAGGAPPALPLSPPLREGAGTAALPSAEGGGRGDAKAGADGASQASAARRRREIGAQRQELDKHMGQLLALRSEAHDIGELLASQCRELERGQGVTRPEDVRGCILQLLKKFAAATPPQDAATTAMFHHRLVADLVRTDREVAEPQG